MLKCVPKTQRSQMSHAYYLIALLGDDLVWKWEDGNFPKGIELEIPRHVVSACRLWATPGSTLELTIDIDIKSEFEPSDGTNPPYAEHEITCSRMVATVASRSLDDHLQLDIVRRFDGIKAMQIRNRWEADMFGYLKELFIEDDATDRANTES